MMATAGRFSGVAVGGIDKIDHRESRRLTEVPLIFEESKTGRRGADVSRVDERAIRGAEILGSALCRTDIEGFPELSEPQVIRHFVRLSQLNFSAATQFYPLGSCTMKYNPAINESMAALPGFAGLHPATPTHLAQGALELMALMEASLCEITGMDACSLHPAAGAQGELAGLLMIRAYHRDRGQARMKVIIPDTAHGTNPASCTLAGFQVVVAKSNCRGFLDANEVRRLADSGTAAMMITNPNTLGIFEPEILEIASILHERGALLYLDGANMNALFGVAKPGHMGGDIVQLNLHKSFSTPHGGGGPGAGPIAVKSHLEKFLPLPRIKRTADSYAFDHDRPHSIGRLRSFHANFGMIIRAYAYILALGADGLEQASRLAILNANYVRRRLEGLFDSATPEPSMHECVLSHDLEKTTGVSTLDIAKRLLDFGIHPPTIYFPLVVPGALMIEPTETEPVEALDDFVSAMEQIHREAMSAPERVKNAPTTTPVSRVDEVGAARRPILRWTRSASALR